MFNSCSPSLSKELISAFRLKSFHFYKATFQLRLHMEYTTPSWYNIAVGHVFCFLCCVLYCLSVVVFILATAFLAYFRLELRVCMSLLFLSPLFSYDFLAAHKEAFKPNVPSIEAEIIRSYIFRTQSRVEWL